MDLRLRVDLDSPVLPVGVDDFNVGEVRYKPVVGDN